LTRMTEGDQRRGGLEQKLKNNTTRADDVRGGPVSVAQKISTKKIEKWRYLNGHRKGSRGKTTEKQRNLHIGPN